MVIFEFQKHQAMWYYLASHAQDIINEYMRELDEDYSSKEHSAFSALDKWKGDWIHTEGHDKDVKNNCYACQYAYEYSEDLCDCCPFKEEFYCDAYDSPYDKLLCAIIRANSSEVSCLCKEIADYPLKDDIVVDVVFERNKHIHMWLWLSKHIDDIINESKIAGEGVLDDYKLKYLQEHNEPTDLTTLCYACEYDGTFCDYPCDHCPLTNFFCGDHKNSLYKRLLNAIRYGFSEEAKDLCVRIAYNPVKKNVLWR